MEITDPYSFVTQKSVLGRSICNYYNGKTAKYRKTTTYRIKFIDSYRFMQCSLSTFVDKLPGIDNKKPENKFIDTLRSVTDSRSQSINKILEIDRKILQKNKLIT